MKGLAALLIEISAKSNDHFKRWKELDSSRGIRKHGEFFLMGEKLIREFLKNPGFRIKAEIVSDGHIPITPSHPSASKFTRVPIFMLAPGLFNEIDFIGTHFNLLVLETKTWPILEMSTPPAGLEVISPLGDPSNLGALARSALAFGASKLVLTEESANPLLPKAIKASAGAVLQIPIFKSQKLEEVLAQDKNIYALDMQGSDIQNFSWPKNMRLAIGEEGSGLKDLPIQHKLKISTGPVESLNATVATSIAMYTYSQKARG